MGAYAERSLVDFSESKSPSLVGILNMGEIIVKVVEGSVAAAGLDTGLRHCDGGRCGLKLCTRNSKRGLSAAKSA